MGISYEFLLRCVNLFSSKNLVKKSTTFWRLLGNSIIDFFLLFSKTAKQNRNSCVCRKKLINVVLCLHLVYTDDHTAAPFLAAISLFTCPGCVRLMSGMPMKANFWRSSSSSSLFSGGAAITCAGQLIAILFLF
jgi:hypothetical protein